MGLDSVGVDFLLEARDGPGYFKDVMTLGRQQLQHFTPQSLRLLLDRHGRIESDESAAAILREADGFADSLFRSLGSQTVDAIDSSSYEGASIVHDMNTPIPDALKGQYDCVIDGGCLEHIFNFPTAIQSCMEMLRVGGKFLSQCCGNNFMGHGLYQFSPELFFRVFDQENGFKIERVLAMDMMGAAHMYEVSDPKVVQSRVEAITRGPIFLFVQAKKLEEVPLWRSLPQQSDYSVAWKQHAEGSEATVHKPGKPRQSMLNQLNQFAKRAMPNFLQAMYRKSRDARLHKQFNPKYFKMIS
jgi:hypothetical protein